MAARWRQFLDGLPAAHAVEMYVDDLDLRESVCDYLRAGFQRGEPALVLGTPQHLASFRSELGDSADGLLVAEDAEALLGRIAADGVPTAERFDAELEPLLARAEALAPGKRCRIFGEMVDLLAHASRPAAERLEELWNHLAGRRGFSLLCAYRLDVFDRRVQTEHLPQICRAHTHVLPAHDAERLDRAVEMALIETVGDARTRDVYYVVGNRLRGERVPVAQDALMWVSANLPGVADRVLEAARRHYRRQAVPRPAG
jgi:hypothetical protein